MTIALTAHIVFDPRRIRDNRWAHDMAHHIVCHRRLALEELADAERRRAATPCARP